MLLRACVALLLLVTAASRSLVAAESAEVISLRAKAEKGNAIAQYNLGLAYMQGQQVRADWPEAFVWLTLASEKGATGKALATLVDTLTDAQLTEGRKRLETYRSAMASGGKAPPAPRMVASQTTANIGGPPSAAPVATAPTTASVVTATPSKEGIAAADSAASNAAEIVTLRNDVRQLGDELAVAWKENGQLKNDLGLAQTSVADGKVRLSTQSLALTRLEEQLAKTSRANDAAAASTAALATAEKEIERLKASVASTTAKLSAMEASVAESGADKSRLIAERDAERIARGKAAADAEAQAREISALRGKLVEAESKVAEANRAVADRGALKNQLTAAEAARSSLTAEKAAVDSVVSRITQEKEALAVRLAQATTEASTRDAENKALTVELKGARKDLETVKASALRQAEEGARASAAAAVAAQTEKIAELNDRLAASTTALNSAEEARATTSAALRRVEFAAKESSAQIADLKARVQSLDAARTAALAEKSQSADREKRLMAELEAAPKEAVAAKARASAAAAELARVTAERDDKEAARAKAVVTAEARATEIDSLKQQLATRSSAADSAAQSQAVVAKSEARVNELQAELQAAKTQLASSEAARSEMTAKYAAANDAAKAGLEQAAALRAQAQSSESGRAQFNTEKEALVAKLASNTAKVDQANRAAEGLQSELTAAKNELEAVRRNAAESSERFSASESVRRDYGAQLNALRAELKETQAAFGSAQTTALRLTEENSQLKARTPSAPPLDLESLRAQLVTAEQKASDAEATSRTLAEENARLKAARVSPTPSTGRAVLVSAPTKPPTRSTGNVPVGANAAVRPVSAPITPVNSAPAASRTHVIVAGDTLTSLSTRYYGTPSRWSEILAANRSVMRDERTLVLGRTLRIP